MVRKLLVFCIVFLSLTSAKANTCRDIFDVPSLPNGFLDTILKHILINPEVDQKITFIRMKYDGMLSTQKMGATVQILPILEKLTDLPHVVARKDSDKKILEMGIDQLLQDLIEVSPQYVSTGRLMRENIEVILSHAAGERLKHSSNEQKDNSPNVVSISSKQMQNNSEYVLARRKVFELIDSYKDQTQIPYPVILGRVEQLLRADSRFRQLSLDEQDQVVKRVVTHFKALQYSGVEGVLESYFKDKARKS